MEKRFFLERRLLVVVLLAIPLLTITVFYTSLDLNNS